MTYIDDFFVLNFSFFLQNWCGTDRIVLIKTIRMLFKKLFEDQGGSPDLVGTKQIVSIANSQWEAECIDYVVSKVISGFNLNHIRCHFKVRTQPYLFYLLDRFILSLYQSMLP